jgi:hypothetical protein
MASGAAVSTATPGAFRFVVSAVDGVGNRSERQVDYSVIYGVCLLYDPTKPHKSGSTVPIKLQICGASGQNESSAQRLVSATGLRMVAATTEVGVEDSGSANPESNFRYDPSLSGYIFNLATRGLTVGDWELTFSVQGDPAAHVVRFRIGR